MPFPMPNQQRQSTEGTGVTNSYTKYIHEWHANIHQYYYKYHNSSVKPWATLMMEEAMASIRHELWAMSNSGRMQAKPFTPLEVLG